MKEIQIITDLFYPLGRNEKLSVIKNSNLDDREQTVMELRFVNGSTIKECAERFNLSIDAYNKFQKKTYLKFYSWLCRLAYLQKVDLSQLIKNQEVKI